MGYFIFLSLFLLFASAPRADAYIDPGTGSYLIQVLLAVIFGVSVGFKFAWRKIASSFLKLFKKPSPPDPGMRPGDVSERQEAAVKNEEE
ncbi:hypothetical protein C4587_01025 [Candidatus Parcubacteria bacterium]|nr:MAG: hypothetical protein C4587_01025 [Candidatus Parcubacteria bacterium]